MEVLQGFEGRWSLERVVRDHLAGEERGFEGGLTLAPDGVGLSYREEGRWTSGGWAGMAASREYLWRAEGARVAVLFPDGRPFHDFGLDDEGQAIRHDCAPDLYVVRYRFGLPGWWEAHWRVTGPRKDYEMETRFRRG